MFRCPSLDSMILIGPFQLEIFYDSTILMKNLQSLTLPFFSFRINPKLERSSRNPTILYPLAAPKTDGVIKTDTASKLSLILSAEEWRFSCWFNHLYVQLQRKEAWYSNRKVHMLDSPGQTALPWLIGIRIKTLNIQRKTRWLTHKDHLHGLLKLSLWKRLCLQKVLTASSPFGRKFHFSPVPAVLHVRHSNTWT